MLRPISFREIPSYPVTVGIAGSAIAMSLLWWTGSEIIRPFGMDLEVWNHCEIWRGLTCILPHADPVHLAFNLYWWIRFGPFLERTYGHIKFGLIIVLLALCSSLAEFMFLAGGIGLSGVVYGFWGLLWVLGRNESRFAGVIEEKTTVTFVTWFFICILLTATDFLPIGNIAHGAGAIAGGLLGFAQSSSGQRKRLACGALGALLLITAVGSTLLWPWTSFSPYKYEAFAYVGSQALQKGDLPKARQWLEIAVRQESADALTWYSLGFVYQKLHNYPEALVAYERAVQRPGATSEMREAAQSMKRYLER